MRHILFTIVSILLASSALATGATPDVIAAQHQAFLETLNKAGIFYSYSNTGKLVILKTEDTAEAIEKIQRVPSKLDLVVVDYKFN